MTGAAAKAANPSCNAGHDLGAKKPQLLQQQANVVPCAAQYGMQRIAQGAFERITAQAPVGLHVPDTRLDRAAPFDHQVQGSGQSALLPRAQDAHPVDLDAAVALVDDSDLRLGVGEDAHLLQRLGQPSHQSGRERGARARGDPGPS